MELFRQTEIVIDGRAEGKSKQQCWRNSAIFFRFRWNNIRRQRLEAQSFYSSDCDSRSHGIRTKARRFLPAGPFLSLDELSRNLAGSARLAGL
ncbi:hypothetical protein [Mesorhizobium prunaredense]|uniref:hypothetical protein n=1 Tax=Mesorhizobium prunaredense TaxID=1631249 RepID=UPI00117E7389|nr:hypothetical protein [Mesorhizobium prunaredense]